MQLIYVTNVESQDTLVKIILHTRWNTKTMSSLEVTKIRRETMCLTSSNEESQ